jgi:hypothetical protein
MKLGIFQSVICLHTAAAHFADLLSPAGYQKEKYGVADHQYHFLCFGSAALYGSYGCAELFEFPTGASNRLR